MWKFCKAIVNVVMTKMFVTTFTIVSVVVLLCIFVISFEDYRFKVLDGVTKKKELAQLEEEVEQANQRVQEFVEKEFLPGDDKKDLIIGMSKISVDKRNKFLELLDVRRQKQEEFLQKWKEFKQLGGSS